MSKRGNSKNLNKQSKVTTIIFVVALLCILFYGIKYVLNKDNITQEKQEEVQEESNTPKEDQTVKEEQEEQEEQNRIDITEQGSYFLRNCNETKYMYGEKDLKIPVLIYHNFRTPIPYTEDIYNLFSSSANFEENVTTLLDAGYTFLTLEDIELYKQGKVGLPEKNITITVDDRQIGCYTEMFPVLKKYDIPATIFIVNKLVGTTDYFSWENAKEMYDTGNVKIHCHGYYHSDATSFGIEELKELYNKSHEEIVEKLGDEKIEKIMAYPAGSSNNATIEALKQEGFNVQVQTRYGTVNHSDLDLTNIGRVRAERATRTQILNAIK